MADAKKTTKLLTDLRAMDSKQLTQKIADLKKELVEHQRANKLGELPSTAVIRKTRKAIAQSKTVQSTVLAATKEVEQTKEEKK